MSIVLLWIATQIITESLPISSSSHIKLLEIFFNWQPNVPAHFDDFLHGPSLIVIALFFFNRWYGLLISGFQNILLLYSTVVRVALAATVTVAIYFFLHAVPLQQHFPLWIGLIITMLSLFSLRWCARDNYESPTIKKSALLGFAQGVALLPGISRLGFTYVVARWLRWSPRHALEFSFAMQTPLIVAAFVRASVSLLRSPIGMQLLNARMCLVIIISSVVAYAGLCLVSYLARTHKMWYFSMYMPIPIITWLVLNL